MTVAARIEDQYTFSLPARESSVPAARRRTRDVLVSWGVPEGDPLVDTVLLVLSELVTNAVVHAGPRSPRVDLALARDADNLVLSVHDDDACLPGPAEDPDLHGEGGRGLWLVGILVRAAGGTVTLICDAQGCGKTFAVRLALPDSG